MAQRAEPVHTRVLLIEDGSAGVPPRTHDELERLWGALRNDAGCG
jgi:hypothetical protein